MPKIWQCPNSSFFGARLCAKAPVAALRLVCDTAALQERTDWSAKAHFRKIRVDLHLTVNPLFQRVREFHASRQRFLERDISCATPEGLLLLKLYALPSLYRQGEIQKENLYEVDIAVRLKTTLARGLLCPT